MKTVASCMRVLLVAVALFVGAPHGTFAQDEGPAGTPMKQEELAQLVAPIALYPDELLTQILISSTYPLEIVQADRWVKQNKSLKGDALAKALEAQKWDPSVKALVNFPSVLASMSEKLDLTTKLGDAFLSQQKDLMDTIQALRKKAMDAGNLKTTKEQKVIVEKEVIIIQPASTQVVYVPTYSPTVVYGAWAYPAYPPYAYYPPPPAAYPAFHFAAGVAVGAAWGYAETNANWNNGSVNYNNNQTVNINNSKNQVNANKNQAGTTANKGGGSWQHDSSHRQGVAYKDNATASKYNKASTNDAARSNNASRGRSDQGASASNNMKGSQGSGRSDAGNKPQASTRDSGARGSSGSSSRASSFEGMDKGGASARDSSSRGSSSRSSASASSSSRSGGSSGGSRSGGGGGRSGGGGRGGGRR